MTKREILKEVLNEGVEGMFKPNAYGNKKINQAIKDLDKLELRNKRGAYKSGYHDALNGRPFKKDKGYERD